jgi:hypothetical protein
MKGAIGRKGGRQRRLGCECRAWLAAVVFVFVIVFVLAVTTSASAVETQADVETDHIDAAYESGPPSFGVLLHPLAMARGWLGAEFDVAGGETAVVSLEADGRWAWGLRGLRIEAGFLIFPLRFAFYGVYVHPTVEWDRVPHGTVVGVGATAGYAWTWRCGATLRVGAGGGYAKALSGEGPETHAFTGLRPEIDADVGWAF